MRMKVYMNGENEMIYNGGVALSTAKSGLCNGSTYRKTRTVFDRIHRCALAVAERKGILNRASGKGRNDSI